MKKLLLLSTLVVLSVSIAFGKQITEAQAFAIAQKYAGTEVVSGQPGQSGQKKMKRAAAHTDNAYYAFNFENNGGFVIISGDDALTELVGYADSGAFSEPDMPENMRSWLNAYAEYVSAFRSGKMKAVRQPTSDRVTVVVRPLVSARWNQDYPYNNLSPTYTADDGSVQHCVTGCAATAMAQLMYYHQWPLQGKGSHSYTHETYGEISVDFSQSVYNWSEMLDVYQYGGFTEAQGDAVAKLMYDCGVSINMDWGPTSGASERGYIPAFDNYFGYDSNLFYRDNMTTDEFFSKITGELDESRPVIFCGSSLGSGHAFVVDGYDSNGFLHVNWGWGGYSDGYFNMNYMDPDNLGIGGGSGSYQWGQSVTTARPLRNGEKPSEKPMRLSYVNDDNGKGGVFSDFTTGATSDPIEIKLRNVYNPNSAPFVGYVAVGFFDASSKLADVTPAYEFSGDRFPAHVYYPGDFGFPYENLSNLPDGEYTVRGIFTLADETKWTRFESASYLSLTIANGKATVSNPFLSLDLSLAAPVSAPETVGLGTSATFKATLFNNAKSQADGRIRFAIKEQGTSDELLSGTKEAIIYDGCEYAAEWTAEISSSIFRKGKTYEVYVAEFIEESGNSVAVSSGFPATTFTVSDPVRQQMRMSFIDYNGAIGGISMQTTEFRKSGTVPTVFLTNVYNPNPTAFTGAFGLVLATTDEKTVLCEAISGVRTFNVNTYMPSMAFQKCLSFADVPAGTYKLFPATYEEWDGTLCTEWTKFNGDHYLRIQIGDDGTVSVLKPEQSVTLKSSSLAKEAELGNTVVLSLDIANNSSFDAYGKLDIAVSGKSSGSVVTTIQHPVDIASFSSATVEVPVFFDPSLFSERTEYVVTVTGFRSDSHYDFTLNDESGPQTIYISNLSGIDAAPTAGIRAYPIPAAETLYLECDSEILGVAVYNAVGAATSLPVQGIGSAKATVSTASLPAGYYVAVVATPQGEKRVRFIRK